MTLEQELRLIEALVQIKADDSLIVTTTAGQDLKENVDKLLNQLVEKFSKRVEKPPSNQKV